MEEFFPPERSAQKKTASSIVEPDFGQAEYIESTKTDKYFLLCRSPTDKDCCYLFQRQSTRRRPNGDYTMYWRCVRCMQISSASPANVIVRNERLTKDPSIGHYEACIPYTDSEIQLMKVKREMRRRVLNDGVRPLLAYQEAVEQLRLQVSNPAQLANLEREIGQYKSNRSSLYRYDDGVGWGGGWSCNPSCWGWIDWVFPWVPFMRSPRSRTIENHALCRSCQSQLFELSDAPSGILKSPANRTAGHEKEFNRFLRNALEVDGHAPLQPTNALDSSKSLKRHRNGTFRLQDRADNLDGHLWNRSVLGYPRGNQRQVPVLASWLKPMEPDKQSKCTPRR